MSVHQLRPLSCDGDVDTRWGSRRLLEDSYVLHADVVDSLRVSLATDVRRILGYLNDEDEGGGRARRERDEYWAEELWGRWRACTALGIEQDS